MLGIATAPQAAADEEESDAQSRSADGSDEGTEQDSPFLRHAREADLATCSGMFSALGDMLTAGANYRVQTFWNDEVPDDHPVSALVGMSYRTEGYAGPAAGYVFASPDGSACAGSMVRVAPYALSCEDLPSILPEGSERLNTLHEVAVYSLGSGGQALLLPTDGSCVVVSIASGAQRSAIRDGARQ